MPGLLDYLSSARDKAVGGLLGIDMQYDQPALVALGGLLSGDISTAKDVTRMRINNAIENLKGGYDKEYKQRFPNPQPFDPISSGAGFLGTIGTYKSIPQLVLENKSTVPKIPVKNVFNNDIGAVDTSVRMKADDAFANNTSTTMSVNPLDIVPTQRTVNVDNIKRVSGVKELPELIQIGDKFYISDGHHRIAKAILDGSTSLNAKVFKNGQ